MKYSYIGTYFGDILKYISVEFGIVENHHQLVNDAHGEDEREKRSCLTVNSKEVDHGDHENDKIGGKKVHFVY